MIKIENCYLIKNNIARIACFVGIILLGLTACKSQPTYQAYPGPAKPSAEVARVFIPKAFNLLNVNGESYTQPLMGHGTIVTFLPGSHEIVIKYVDFWEPTADVTEKVASQPMLLAFDVKAGGYYSIRSRELKDVNAAKEFAKTPEVDIIDKHSQTSVATDIKYQLKEKGLIAAFLDSLSPNNPQPTPIAADTTSKEETGKEPALEMLKYWWQKATPEQQENFMKWVVEK